MAIVHLQSGLLEQGSESESSSGVPSSLTRRALLVYEGEFESMDGVVNVGRDELTTLATNHNGHVETASRLAEGKESMKDYPPVQLDHSTSAKDTVGRMVGKLELSPYKTKDGKEVMAAYGNVKILGEENVVKVMDGRWTHLSVGVDFEKGKFSELTITPFPAAPEASLLKKNTEMTGALEWEKRLESILKRSGIVADVGMSGNRIAIGVEDKKDVAKVKSILQQTKGAYQVMGVRTEADGYSVIEVELNTGDLEMAKKKLKKLSEGDKSMDKEKMKKHMMEVHKMSEEEAEDKMAKCTEEEMKKMAAEMDEHEKKMAAEKDEKKEEMSEEKDSEKKELAEEKDEEKKEMSEEEDKEKKKLKEEEDKEKKMSAARDRIVRLSSDFRKAFEGSQLAAKKGRIVSRLSALKASAKITPAEIKKIDVEKLASHSDEALDLVLKSYEDREPVIMTGALGSIKAHELHDLSKEIKMSRLEAETRKNMSLLKNTVKDKTKRLAEGPEEVSIHVDTTPHVHQEMAKCYGDACKLMDEGKLAEAKELLKKYMMKPMSEGRMDMVEHDKQLSALAEESIKMQNKFDELQKLAVSLVG